jgi:hypothetical protein
MKNIYICIMCLICFSCTGQEENIKPLKSFTFPTGYFARSKFCGNFYDKDSNLFFYFGEPVSYKEIQIFDSNQKLVKKVSLRNLDYIYGAQTITMPCLDSIIITIANPLQLVYVLDSNANIIYEKYFPYSYIKDSITYEYGATTTGNKIYHDGYIYLSNEVVLPYNSAKEFAKCLRHEYSEFQFFKIKLDSNNNERQQFGNYFDRIYKYPTSYRNCLHQYTIENNYIFHYFVQTNKVAITNCNDIYNTKIIDLKSKYTTIGLKEDEVTEKSNLRKIYDKNENISCFSTGSLFNVVWDNYRNRYYFFIKTKFEKDTSRCDWIIQTFDTNFNFVKECKINNDDDFDFHDISITKEGLLINCNLYFYGKRENTTKREMVYKLYAIDF